MVASMLIAVLFKKKSFLVRHKTEKANSPIMTVFSIGFAAVEVAMDGAQFTSSGVLFLYSQAPVVNKLNPMRGSAAGGDTITVTGDHFTVLSTSDEKWYCIFGSYDTIVTYVDSTTITCPSPPQSQVSSTTVDFFLSAKTATGFKTSPSLQFHINDKVSISDFYPKRGPISGGTIYLLILAGTPFHRRTICKFAKHFVKLMFF